MRLRVCVVVILAAVVTACGGVSKSLTPAPTDRGDAATSAHSFAIPRAPLVAPPSRPPFAVPAPPSAGRRAPRDAGAAHLPFFNGEVALSNSVYYLRFPIGVPFGYYSYLGDPHYIYHNDLGYEYVFDSTDPNSVYMYDFASGHFWWTGATLFPYIYDFTLNSFLYYFPDGARSDHYSTNPRYFYDFVAAHAIAIPAPQLPSAGSTVVYYQPTPYRTPFDDRATHVLDGWLPSNFYNMQFQRDDELQSGGWGDAYYSYLQFDLTGLPKSVSDASLQLWAYSRGDNSTPVGINMYSPDTAWASTDALGHMSTAMTWGSRPATNTYIGTTTPGALNSFWNFPITSLYNGWQTTPATNHGMLLAPTATNNNFDVWYSSRFASDGFRPLLKLTFTSPAPVFKMPLPRDYSWIVTTEIGGYDCHGSAQDGAHANKNYYSIDFGWENLPAHGQQKYPPPAHGSSTIPITPAANGMVAEVNDPNLVAFNGNYIVISHDSGGSKSHGYSTRYLHLQDPPQFKVGDMVYQGTTILGYMGDTGATGNPPQTHLHFGIRYDDKGYPDTAELTYAVMSGWLLKSFQTECTGRSPTRFYLSS